MVGARNVGRGQEMRRDAASRGPGGRVLAGLSVGTGPSRPEIGADAAASAMPCRAMIGGHTGMCSRRIGSDQCDDWPSSSVPSGLAPSCGGAAPTSVDASIAPAAGACGGAAMLRDAGAGGGSGTAWVDGGAVDAATSAAGICQWGSSRWGAAGAPMPAGAPTNLDAGKSTKAEAAAASGKDSAAAAAVAAGTGSCSSMAAVAAMTSGSGRVSSAAVRVDASIVGPAPG